MSINTPLFKKIKEYYNSGLGIEETESKLWEEFGVTRACLVSDSTGFTRTTKTKGISHFLTLVMRMRGIVEEIVASNNGLNFRAEADNVYAEFNNSDDAIKTAFEMHEAIERDKLMLSEDEKYKVCIGIGYGEVLLAGEEGVYGDEMNIASKLGEDTADAGETLLSQNAYRNLAEFKDVRHEIRNTLVSGVEIDYFACFR